MVQLSENQSKETGPLNIPTAAQRIKEEREALLFAMPVVFSDYNSSQFSLSPKTAVAAKTPHQPLPLFSKLKFRRL